MMRIAVDAMGGDYAPEEIVKGAVASLREPPEKKIILVGDEKRIKELLRKEKVLDSDNISIVQASEVISMGENPLQELRRKKDSSIGVAVDQEKKGFADAIVTAGNTGAAVVATKIKLRFLPGIIRPAIATTMPTPEGVNVLIDAGANVDCTAVQLIQFGVMGQAYAKYILGKKDPSIGIINVGEEETKGNNLVKEAHQLFKESELRFFGNIEGRDILKTKTDVIVTDGFVGNVALKVSEGVAKVLQTMIREELNRNIFRKLGALMSMGAFRALKKRADYEEYGGAPLLGINGTCIIGHGSSSSKAIKNAIKVACKFVEMKVNKHIVEDIEKVNLRLALYANIKGGKNVADG